MDDGEHPSPPPRKMLLWLDDDPRDRFIYEERVLTNKDGWTVRWAGSVTEAAFALRQESFAAMILDQMTPWSGPLDKPDIWSGCKLLSWLRGRLGPTRPWPEEGPGGGLDELGRPGWGNPTIPVLIVSALDDEDVARATTLIEPLPMLSKPVDLAYLRGWLTSKTP